LRFILGIVIVIQSILEKDWLIFSIGTLLSFSAIINLSYCSMGACEIPVNSTKKSNVSGKI
ncbi:MAG: hypothetical protein ACK452_07160, partial [Bacteroidota bacterium]